MCVPSICVCTCERVRARTSELVCMRACGGAMVVVVVVVLLLLLLAAAAAAAVVMVIGSGGRGKLASSASMYR